MHVSHEYKCVSSNAWVKNNLKIPRLGKSLPDLQRHMLKMAAKALLGMLKNCKLPSCASKVGLGVGDKWWHLH